LADKPDIATVAANFVAGVLLPETPRPLPLPEKESRRRIRVAQRGSERASEGTKEWWVINARGTRRGQEEDGCNHQGTEGEVGTDNSKANMSKGEQR